MHLYVNMSIIKPTNALKFKMYFYTQFVIILTCFDKLYEKKNIILTLVHLLVVLCELIINARP